MDGQAYPIVISDQPVQLDPGMHVIAVEANRRVITRQVSIEPGEQVALAMLAGPDDTHTRPAAPSSPGHSWPTPEQAPGSGAGIAVACTAAVTVGFAAVGIAAALSTGPARAEHRRRLEQAEQDSAGQRRIDRLETTTMVGVVGSSVGAAATLSLLIIPLLIDDDGGPTVAGVKVQAGIGPGGIQVGGQF